MADRPHDQPKTAADGAVSAPLPREPHARDVLFYLRRHPDFLDRYPEALRLLRPPVRDGGDGVLDFQHFLLERLRREVTRLQGEQRNLIATGRSNLTSQCRVHKAVLALLKTTSFERLLQVVTTDLAVLIDVDVVTIAVESSGSPAARRPMPGIQLLQEGTVDAVLGAARDALLSTGIEGDPALFGSAAGLVRSQALLRLSFGRSAPVGLMCLGTRKSDAFHPGLGTELLGFLARSLEITISQWLNLGR